MYAIFQNELLSNTVDPRFIEEKFVAVTGELSSRTYSKGRVLGRGGFAKVVELTCTDTGKTSAAKIISKAAIRKPRTRHKLMNELKIHRALHHENVLRFEHCFEDSSNLYILLEVCSNQTLGELLERRKRLTELEARCLLHQVLSGLRYIHANHVLHRDIKLSNLLLTDNMQVKIADFGLACKIEFEGERKRTFCGTPNYIAPEILEARVGYSYEADVWSVGILAYTIVIGHPPFNANGPKQVYAKIRAGAYTFPSNVQVSNELKAFIEDVLVLEHDCRPSVSDLLNHPFFTMSPFPPLLPASCLVVPPSSSFLKKYKVSPREQAELTPTIKKVQPLRNELSPRVRSPLRSQQSTRKSLAVSRYVAVTGQGPQVWVTKWIDYSAKYGLGYLLSNNNYGIYFNDSSKLLHKRRTLLYQAKGTTSAAAPQEYTTEEFPKEATKKLNLLAYFRKHFGSELFEQSDQDVYILKWITTPQCAIYRLSDKTVQAYFTDKTEVILCAESKEVVYVDKRGNTSFQSIREVGQNTELARRVNYVKEAFKSILSSPRSPSPLDRHLSQYLTYV